MNIISASVKLY